MIVYSLKYYDGVTVMMMVNAYPPSPHNISLPNDVERAWTTVYTVVRALGIYIYIFNLTRDDNGAGTEEKETRWGPQYVFVISLCVFITCTMILVILNFHIMSQCWLSILVSGAATLVCCYL